MQKRYLIFLLGIIILPIIICSFFLFRTFIAGTSKCLPISYPDGELLNLQSHESQFTYASVPIKQLMEFYDVELSPNSIFASEPYIPGAWRIQKYDDEIPLFDCYNGFNEYTGESGCIFLHEVEDGTIIEFAWALGESAPGCESTYSSSTSIE